MNDAELSSEVAATSEVRQRSSRVDLYVGGALLLAVWAELVLKMRVDWSTNAQYEFGLFVPFFILFLLYQRFQDRPQPLTSHGSAGALLLFGALLVCLLPIRLIQEANPDWRPWNWVHAGVVATLTLTAAYYFGGKAWVRHFAPPIGLLFFALPWALTIEQTVIQSMARTVSAFTVEILNTLDVPALQNGNVIEVPTGPVGIADACSGVRSLAGTLMASYFFGEFYRLAWTRRAVLLVSGICVAFLLNLVRTSILGWVAASRGLEAIESWHDQTGFIIFCAAFGVLWVLGRLLAADEGPQIVSTSTLSPLAPVPMAFLATGLVWLAATEISTEAWYRWKERDLPHYATWNFVVPADVASIHPLQVADEARAILRYSEGRSLEFAQFGSPTWQIHYFRWAPGRSSSQLAVLHRPQICLPAAGLKFVSQKPVFPLKVSGVTIPFECSIFDSQGTPLYVFRTLSEDRRPLGATSGFDQSIRGRLQSAFAGRRNLGQKLLQIGILGPENQQMALGDLQARLPQFLTVSE